MLGANTVLQNRYRVRRELGHGGMGTVYEALDQRVNCIVALKETLAGNSEEARRAFEREASLLGNLRHSSLPKVMDYFSENGGDFLIMEFIPGYDLAELLELRGNSFPQAQIIRWAYELLKVLEYLHGQQPPILHRDIKPSNLKLTKQGEIFLLDFGLAKGSLGQMATMATNRSVRGYTPIYASLEQIHGHGTDARSDIYSLGATLYHLLTGVAPIDAPARYHAVEDDQPDPLLPIQALSLQASANVAEVIHRAMGVSRKQRHASAAEMRKALRNAAEEDDRRSAEEEYSRAESRRREIEEEKQKAKDEAAARSEEEGRAQEAETRKKKEEGSRQAAERQRREEAERLSREAREAKEAEETAARRRADVEKQAEAERHAEEDARRLRADLPTVHMSSEPTVTATGNALPDTEEAPSQPAIKTLPAPQPARYNPDFGLSTFGSNELTRTTTGGSRRHFLVVAAVLALAFAAAFIAWSWRGTTTNDSDAQTQLKTGAAQQAKPVENAPPTGMVQVPGGTFTMGRENGDEAERPAHEVTLQPFFIDAHEVTNEEYERFLKARALLRPPGTWKNRSYPSGAARKPVTGVTWNDASAYAMWAGKRLPTEEEWEFAARGTDGRIYPWGNNWQQGSANANGASQSMSDVGAFNGTSPFGSYDMVGNAWEWTASDFRAYPGGRLPANLPTRVLKVIRGGSYESGPDVATTTFRFGWLARGGRYEQTGFRCAKDMTQ